MTVSTSHIIRLIDSLYEELYSTTDAQFTFEHVDFLERRLFEIREAIEATPLCQPVIPLNDIIEGLDDCVRLLTAYDEHDGEEHALYRRCIRLLSQLNILHKGEYP
ncbi:MAG: hypothetical protein KDA96_22430 [Planctomycetaceae bacterium]|nr:hypothetical protein [Planctomycetaceae bacterium]